MSCLILKLCTYKKNKGKCIQGETLVKKKLEKI